ncbi:MAG: hypothetical protein WA160_16060 [Pseudobdellovibrio sp.]
MKKKKDSIIILSTILNTFLNENNFPNEKVFRVNYKEKRQLIDSLVNEDYLRLYNNTIRLTTKGLIEINSNESNRIILLADRILKVLAKIYLENPNSNFVELETLTEVMQISFWDIQVGVFFLTHINFYSSLRSDEHNFPMAIQLSESILDITNLKTSQEIINIRCKKKITPRSREPWQRSHTFQALGALLTIFGILSGIYFKFYFKEQ